MRKGFTLMEIIVVLVIVSILAIIAIPNYMIYMWQGAAKAAQANLIAIYNAEKNYYFENGFYCTNSGTSIGTSIGTSTDKCTNGSINSYLSLNISDNNFTYECSDSASKWLKPWRSRKTSGYRCYASSTFSVTYNGPRGPESGPVVEYVDFSYPIVLPGGSGPPLPGLGPQNPGCEPANSSYCPS